MLVFSFVMVHMGYVPVGGRLRKSDPGFPFDFAHCLRIELAKKRMDSLLSRNMILQVRMRNLC